MVSWMHAILKSCIQLAMEYKKMVTARPVFIVHLISGPPTGNQTPKFLSELHPPQQADLCSELTKQGQVLQHIQP